MRATVILPAAGTVRAGKEWPSPLITRRAPLECFVPALPGDIKVTIDRLQ